MSISTLSRKLAVGLLVCAAHVCLFAPAWADQVDDAAGLPAPEAIPKLESLLEAARERGDEAETVRIHGLLAGLRLAQGETYAALEDLEVLSRLRKRPLDHVRYAEALVSTARSNMQGGTTAAGVIPYVQDALAALDEESARSIADVAVRGRAMLTRAEALYFWRKFDESVTVLEALRLEDYDQATRRRALDLLARANFAAGRFEAAGKAFAAAGNPLGAAAAYDAAKQPAKSVPLHAQAIRQDPGNAALIERALAGVRYTGAHALLLDALADVELPKAAAGVPLLLARADLLEAAGRTAEALDPLRTAAERDPKDPRAPARLGRLILLTGDVEDEQTWDDAAAAYRSALERDPEDDAAAQGLFYIAGRDYGLLWKRWRAGPLRERCLIVQRALADARPDDALALSNLGNTLRVLGDLEGALAAYEKARAANPYDPGVRSDQGLALSAADRPEEALAAYLESVDMDAGHLAGRQNAARALWLQGDDDGAAAHLGAATRTARAVARSPGTYRFLLERSWRTRRDPRLR